MTKQRAARITMGPRQIQELWVRQLKTSERVRYWLEYMAAKAIFSSLNLLPFRQRRNLMAWVLAHVVGPLVGYRKRIRKNLDLVWPGKGSAEEKDQLVTATAYNVGRTVCELFSPRDLLAMAHETEITGPGLVAMEEARETGRPAVIVSGHFGNYDIVRAGLIAQGFNVGALYRRMNNPYFHKFYFDKISTIGMPLFERGRPGLGHMLRHLKGGGTLAALIDVRSRHGKFMPFLGKPARTSTSMAELALRYDAILVPFFATRLPGDAGFSAVLDAPIPHSEPEAMTKALTEALERRVNEHPEQWFWIHNRWTDADR